MPKPSLTCAAHGFVLIGASHEMQAASPGVAGQRFEAVIREPCGMPRSGTGSPLVDSDGVSAQRAAFATNEHQKAGALMRIRVLRCRGCDYGRALIEIRMSGMSGMMLDRLEIERKRDDALFKGVPVRVWNTGFDETVEVLFRPNALQP
jgi:hypothetical protein